jgi:AbrB family looped-hinge helix DNA binding protein
MAEPTNGERCCEPQDEGTGCCAVQAMVSVDERGQMVIPKDVRDRAGIRPGDKFALVTWEKDGVVCCISLIRADNLAGMVKGLLQPVMQDILEPGR